MNKGILKIISLILASIIFSCTFAACEEEEPLPNCGISIDDTFSLSDMKDSSENTDIPANADGNVSTPVENGDDSKNPAENDNDKGDVTSTPDTGESTPDNSESTEESEPSEEHKVPIENLSPEDQILRLAENLKNTPYYKSNIKGEVKASFYTQKINDTRMKCRDEAYLRAVSTSALVDVGREVYFANGKAVLRVADDIGKDQWSDDFSVMTYDEYRRSDGNNPFELSNYIISPETVKDASLVRKKNGKFVVTAYIDTVKGTKYYASKMKNYGNLSKLPVFSECKITISFNADGTIRTLKSEDKYKISILGMNLDCQSQLTEVFEYSDNISIPNIELFRSHLK